ncbi:glycoside hydrolase family 127 protein [Phytoactinopolyspora endophytica]|uniref:glycoside hydrolase family 127 protein n=1 Tax=Phytoactinopolyspora endophytica TaxID=1642495 RepID=UPI00101D1410|nr:beta-L-arabinofuranosidase domain-containing protein [Phytoactinopolyspora endophytica]
MSQESTTLASHLAQRGPAAPTRDAWTVLRPLGPHAVQITSGLWHQRAQANRAASIPEGLTKLGEAGNLANLEIAAGRSDGDAIGPIFADSDVYKWLEAAAWEYAREPDEELLAEQLRVTALVAAAQQDDGYLDSVMQAREFQRYGNLPWSHEHYCAGHLIQAAVAQVRGTGYTDLLDVAVKLADHLAATFGDGKRRDVDGHPVVEMALVELYRETGNRPYLDLARFFVQARGHGLMESYGNEPTYYSDRVPVREARTVEGHAVRAVYLGAGAADVAVETGDEELLKALSTQYDSMERSKQYVTGGLGSRWEGEAFGDPFELPTDRGYAETCAAIGGVQWAWRMLLATGEARYADQIERMLLNGFLAGVSLAGTEYFYVNPLQLRSDAHPDENRSPAHGRRGWFTCACCPPNIMRTFSSLAGHVATADHRGVQIHQYAAGAVRVPMDGDALVLDVETEYPWDGAVRLRVASAPARDVEIALRIPAWATDATLDGRPVTAGGYSRVSRTWTAGDEVVLELPMQPRLTVADHRVDAVRGCVAIERGPFVYALEQVDQEAGAIVDDVRIDAETGFEVEHRPDLLGGVTVVRASGSVEGRQRPVTLTAIPYYAWANRGPGPMRVWIPVSQ